MSRTHAALAPGAYDDAQNARFAALSESTEKGVFLQEVVREVGLNTPVDIVMAFEAFLRLPEIDEAIEHDAEHSHHHSPGSASAYHDAMLRIATEKFNVEGVSVNDLLVVHDGIFARENSAKTRQKVRDIIAENLMVSMGMKVRPVAVAPETVPAPTVESLADTAFEELIPTGEVVPDDVANLLEELEAEHIVELEPIDMAAYTQADPIGRLIIWQDRIFTGDHLYARLKSVRAAAKHGA